jgi:hypothetical protein
VELETITGRADRFGDANLRVPEAPGPVEVGVGSGGTLLGAVHYCLFRVVPEARVAAVDTEEAAGVADLADTAVAHITEVADAEAAVEVDGVAVPEGPALDASF